MNEVYHTHGASKCMHNVHVFDAQCALQMKFRCALKTTIKIFDAILIVDFVL